MPHVIAVAGGGRGVGKSTVTAALARLLAGAGGEVLVAVTPPDAADMLRLLEFPAARRKRHEDSESLSRRVLSHGQGLSLLVLDPREAGPVHPLQGYSLLLEQMDGFRRHLDVVLLDCGAETLEDNLFLAGLAQEVVVVTTIHPRPVEEARAFMVQAAAAARENRFRLLVNGTSQPEAIRHTYAQVVSGSDFPVDIGLDLLGGLPFQERLAKAWDQTSLPELAAHFEPLLEALFGQVEDLTFLPKGGVQMFWRSLLFCQDCPTPVCRGEEDERPPFSLDGCPVRRFVNG